MENLHLLVQTLITNDPIAIHLLSQRPEELLHNLRLNRNSKCKSVWLMKMIIFY